MRIVLFDIDGTLLLSGGAGLRALNRAWEEIFGHPGAMNDIRPDGMTDGAIIAEMGRRRMGRPPTAEEEGLVEKLYLRYLEDELPRSEGYRLMPGVTELLKRLSGEEDLLLGLVTGNFEPASRLKLRRGALEGFFRFGGYATDSFDRMELTRIGIERGRALAGAPVPDRAVFLVGDTVHDVRCGRASGARVVAVATGSTPAETLRAEGPEHVLPDLTDTERVAGILRG
ncbi:MAG: HAD hydrolase-like protein [Candidatus Eisenbacteria bacterium]|nr:HAD hydrolase-like protein [Candidatus Eisenbacteria bacterium]